jgi:hypothetical protein
MIMCCTFRALEKERERRYMGKDEWWSEEEHGRIEGFRE